MTNMASDSDGLAAEFGCSLKELKDLMALKGQEAYNKIQQDYNGVQEICKRLKTSPTEGIFLSENSVC